MSSGFDRLGAEIQDRYRLEREIGRGGMARVFLAKDLRHGRSVALKVLDPKLASEGVARFLREIDIASRLVHPHILGLLDSGEVAGLPYYVMPYVSGDSLRARLRREGELAIDTAVRIFREIADALAYAHGEGVVHRDVKPENVLFVGDHVQVADFGVAKALDAFGPEAGLTAAGLAVGTPAYMAPEQAVARELDHRVDIYALGLVTYEMLTGTNPSRGAIEPLERLRPNIPRSLSAVVMRCLEPRPLDRWPSCDDILRQLDLLMGSEETGTAVWSARELEWASFRLMEETCRRLDRASFDPRMIGDSLQYLDNRARTDVLVACYPACGLDAEQFAPFLRTTRYRALSLSPFGFEGHRRRRPSLSLNDHLVLARDWLRAMVAQIEPRLCLLVGFSSGADVALRLAAMEDAEGYPFPLDGCLALECNLGLETCFVTRNLAALGASGEEEETLAALRSVGAAPATLDDWIDVHDYLVQIARRFRGGLEPLQTFARDIVQPFEAGPLDAFVEWYRAASRQGRRLRCVFNDNAVHQRLVRDLHLRNLDQGILGDRYEKDSILIEPDASHFDLIEPGRIERHLDALILRIGRRTH